MISSHRIFHSVVISLAMLVILLCGIEPWTAVAQEKRKFRLPRRALWERKTWTPIFNGEDLQNWESVGDAVWSVENGQLVGSGGKGDIFTTGQYANFVLRVKFKSGLSTNSGVFWRVPPGSERPNRAGYEVEIINIPDHQWPTGSIFTLTRAYAGLQVDNEWNEFEIYADGDYIRVSVNGTIASEIHDRRSARGQIGFQHHKDQPPIYFKDLSIQELPDSAPPGPTIEERLENAPGNWQPLFDGRTLTGWEQIGPGNWDVEDGTITGRWTERMGWLITKEEFGDFVLELQCKTVDNSNSGICIRWPYPATPEAKRQDPTYTGFEIQVENWDEGAAPNPTGSIYNLVRALAKLGKINEWNTIRIYAVGDQIATYVNGQKAAEAHAHRHARGVIGVQVHRPAEPIRYKDIRIKTID